MSEENKNLNTISEDTANADSNAVAETADKRKIQRQKRIRRISPKRADSKSL